MGELINTLFDRLHELLGLPLFFSSGKYRLGTLFGFLMAGAVGWLSNMYVVHRRRMENYFATIPPSLRPSPSGFQSMVGCSRSGCILVTITGVLLFMLAGSLYACTH
jgi:hypothetical protein